MCLTLIESMNLIKPSKVLEFEAVLPILRIVISWLSLALRIAHEHPLVQSGVQWEG